ncbi:hypothetical protein [Larkinella soli]|uniref:hypothetical protein n=1 Tax=Larkinella soli TaxID=1770527 RepID=UPI000FFB4E5C|nr:hypothetical protein [Larkinella soli]
MRTTALLLTGLLLLTAAALYGQPSGGSDPVISNLRVEVNEERVKVQYDVAGIGPQDSVSIRVERRSGGFFSPKTVTGDVGKGVPPGENKTIYWDYRLDGVRIDEEIRVTVVVIPSNRSERAVGGGPANALLSALVPGLGNIRVQPGRKVGLRPLITVAFGGMLTYGLVQRSRSRDQYALYQQQPDAPTAEPYYQKSARHRHRYLIATRAAALVWAADVTYTALKGYKNRKHTQGRIVADLIGRTPVIGYQWRF